MSRCAQYGSSGRRVRTIAIEHERDANGTEEGLLRFSGNGFTRGNTRATNENGRVVQLRRTASKHGSMDQGSSIAGFHSAILQQMIDFRVDGYHRVKDAGMWIRVELDQDAGVTHHWTP
jgi:hypothetical protein